MKVIMSHDVDHITFREHLNDGIAAKFCIRTMLEMASLAISPYTAFQRVKRAWQNKWNNIEDLIIFDKSHNIDSTFLLECAIDYVSYIEAKLLRIIGQ